MTWGIEALEQRRRAEIETGKANAIVAFLQNMLASTDPKHGAGARVTVVPATATFDEIMAHEPDGFFLSNGPGDPAATGEYAVPVIKQMLETKKPLFGICLGHQMLALAVGGMTSKMFQGHRGANHPVKRLSDEGFGVWAHDNWYSLGLREKLPYPDSAIRVGLIHYNTADEIDRFNAALARL